MGCFNNNGCGCGGEHEREHGNWWIIIIIAILIICCCFNGFN